MTITAARQSIFGILVPLLPRTRKQVWLRLVPEEEPSRLGHEKLVPVGLLLGRVGDRHQPGPAAAAAAIARLGLRQTRWADSVIRL